MVSVAPTFRAPTSECLLRARSSSVAWASRDSALGRYSLPSSFSCRRLPTRSNSWMSNWFSNSLRELLAADCDMARDAAARVMFLMWAPARKTSSSQTLDFMIGLALLRLINGGGHIVDQ